jgi:hypothetical protein
MPDTTAAARALALPRYDSNAREQHYLNLNRNFLSKQTCIMMIASAAQASATCNGPALQCSSSAMRKSTIASTICRQLSNEF